MRGEGSPFGVQTVCRESLQLKWLLWLGWKPWGIKAERNHVVLFCRSSPWSLAEQHAGPGRLAVKAWLNGHRWAESQPMIFRRASGEVEDLRGPTRLLVPSQFQVVNCLRGKIASQQSNSACSVPEVSGGLVSSSSNWKKCQPWESCQMERSKTYLKTWAIFWFDPLRGDVSEPRLQSTSHDGYMNSDTTCFARASVARTIS